jgi:hypothetical protein
VYTKDEDKALPVKPDPQEGMSKKERALANAEGVLKEGYKVGGGLPS